MSICCGTMICFIDKRGRKCNKTDAVIISDDEFKEAWRLLTSSSVYALEEELKRGYITISGGHRVGIAGTAVWKDGKIKTQKDIYSLNYRFSRDLKGCGSFVFPYVTSNGTFENTLIFSPPGCGKTTLLRDLSRLLSEQGHNVSIVDERGEIAAMEKGQLLYDLGSHTDVLTGFPKSEGMILALRSLGPTVLVTDEIGSKEDQSAVEDAVRCGVKLLLTAHGGSSEELMCRPILKNLLAAGVFQYLISLGGVPFPGTVKGIFLRKYAEERFIYVEDPSFFDDRRSIGLFWSDPLRESETEAQRN
ncbi:MAG: stage III sporulation protein AA [Firmicutes bacterium]|nr:stage III sporulation protein AA [Bacillota bacterium]